MKNTIISIAVRLLAGAAMLTAITEVSRFCPLFVYQTKEPASVRKLRKF